MARSVQAQIYPDANIYRKQKYRNTEMEKNRNKEIQNYRITYMYVYE